MLHETPFWACLFLFVLLTFFFKTTPQKNIHIYIHIYIYIYIYIYIFTYIYIYKFSIGFPLKPEKEGGKKDAFSALALPRRSCFQGLPA